MRIYVFTASKDASFGFTTNAGGDNLPDRFGPWMLFKDIDIQSFEEHRIGVDVEEMLHSMKEDGYFVMK